MWFLFGEISSSSGCLGWDSYVILLWHSLSLPYNYFGGNGTGSDTGIISEYSLRAALVENTIRFHPAEPLPQDYRNISYLIPAHGASPIRPWLMKPYSMKAESVQFSAVPGQTSCGEYLWYLGAAVEMVAYNDANCHPASANMDCNVAQFAAHESPCA